MKIYSFRILCMKVPVDLTDWWFAFLVLTLTSSTLPQRFFPYPTVRQKMIAIVRFISNIITFSHYIRFVICNRKVFNITQVKFGCRCLFRFNNLRRDPRSLYINKNRACHCIIFKLSFIVYTSEGLLAKKNGRCSSSSPSKVTKEKDSS